MIKSMTGFGKATGIYSNKKFNIEVKSLNSKQLDLNIRMPGIYKEKEIALRKLVGPQLERGKVDLGIYFEASEEDQNHKINKGLVQKYFADLKEIEAIINVPVSEDYLSTLMRMPEVFRTERPELDEEEWSHISALIQEAIKNFNEFRSSEGEILENDLQIRLANIERLLKEVEQYEHERLDKVKEKIRKNLSELISSDKVDDNRFEQELIYYIEKFDVTEEKVRLTGHLNYFRETLKGETAQGKKLGFIGQEMGREINTLGSKANHAEIQKIVVQMKDELEKVKEQILNVL